jgi:hypothetical protein
VKDFTTGKSQQFQFLGNNDHEFCIDATPTIAMGIRFEISVSIVVDHFFSWPGRDDEPTVVFCDVFNEVGRSIMRHLTADLESMSLIDGDFCRMT